MKTPTTTTVVLANALLLWAVVVARPSPDYDSDEDSDDSGGVDDGGRRVACGVQGSRWKVCRECDPKYPEECALKYEEDCKCRDISLNQTDTLEFGGGSDCQSERDGRKWCYVDSRSTCFDKREETADYGNLWLPRGTSLYYSFEACSYFVQDDYEEHLSALGNEEFLVDYELSSEEDLSESLIDRGFRTSTPEECQATCLSFEKVCFGWTFKDYDGTSGRCILKSSQVCCNQNSKKIPAEGSMSGFTCDNCQEEKCCWSTSGRCPCNLEVHQSGTQFCAGCSEAQTQSGTIAFVREKQPCRAGQNLFEFIGGRWRRVGRKPCKGAAV